VDFTFFPTGFSTILSVHLCFVAIFRKLPCFPDKNSILIKVFSVLLPLEFINHLKFIVA